MRLKSQLLSGTSHVPSAQLPPVAGEHRTGQHIAQVGPVPEGGCGLWDPKPELGLPR